MESRKQIKEGTNTSAGVQQELLLTARRLTLLCDKALDELEVGYALLCHELTENLAASRAKCDSAFARTELTLERKKQVLLNKLDLTRQNSITELMDFATALQKELLGLSKREKNRASASLQQSLNDLTAALDDCQHALNRFQKVDCDPQRRGGSATGLSSAERFELVLESQRKKVEQLESSIDEKINDRTRKRDELIGSLRALLSQQRRRFEDIVKNQQTLLSSTTDEYTHLHNETKEEVGRLREAICQKHKACISEILRDLNAQSKQLSSDNQARLFGVCNQLVTARAIVEEDIINKISQAATRAEELLLAERASIRQLYSESRLTIEERTFEETNRQLLSIKTGASGLISAISKQLYEEFSKRVFLHVNQIDKQQKELCQSLEQLSNEFSELLESRINAVDTEIDVIRQEAELIRVETENWIAAMSFYRDSLAFEMETGE